jgi:hypothetical protein
LIIVELPKAHIFWDYSRLGYAKNEHYDEALELFCKMKSLDSSFVPLNPHKGTSMHSLEVRLEGEK